MYLYICRVQLLQQRGTQMQVSGHPLHNIPTFVHRGDVRHGICSLRSHFVDL